MDGLRCNFQSCHKSLKTTAWVTSCSHVFCAEHGDAVFLGPETSQCPVCSVSLPNPLDICKADLNPPEQFKSMILTGLEPDIVLDIAYRAISFWNYQICLERHKHEFAVKTFKERISILEVQYEALIAKLRAEIAGFQRTIEDLKSELETAKRKSQELTKKIKEKNTQCQKLQLMYENAKRTRNAKNCTPNIEQDSVLAIRSSNNKRYEDFKFHPVTPSTVMKSKPTSLFK